MAVISSYFLLGLVAALLSPDRRLWSASLVFLETITMIMMFLITRPTHLEVWGLRLVQAELSRAFPLLSPSPAALELVRLFMPLPARLEIDPNMVGVEEPWGELSPSLLRGMVEDLAKWTAVLELTGVENGSPSTSDMDIDLWLNISPLLV